MKWTRVLQTAAAAETLLFQELRALNDAMGLGYNLRFWRTASVD
jgi:hypothetical protein